jgi:sarcosine oxidase subunit beta
LRPDEASRGGGRRRGRHRALESCGYLFHAHSEGLLQEPRGNVALQNDVGVPSRIVGAAEAAELVPGPAVERVAGGAWCAEDGYFDKPQTVVETFSTAWRSRWRRRGGSSAMAPAGSSSVPGTYQVRRKN